MSAQTRDVANMFNRISRTYDLLNHVLSFGIDVRWRKRAIRALEVHSGMRVLDCGAGTGDMALEMHRAIPGVQTVLLDPARSMLLVADGKADLIPPERFSLVQGSAEALPFPDAHFDRFMVAFGIRNFSDLSRGLSELCRTLKPGGLGAILEFTPDRSRVIDSLFQWYMRRVLTPLGALISRDREAYSYLARTVERFHSTEELIQILESVGLTLKEKIPLTFGIAKLLVVQRRM